MVGRGVSVGWAVSVGMMVGSGDAVNVGGAAVGVDVGTRVWTQPTQSVISPNGAMRRSAVKIFI